MWAMTHSIRGGSGDPVFAIGETTGVITTVPNSLAMSSGRLGYYVMQWTVDAGGMPDSLSSTVTVDIHVAKQQPPQARPGPKSQQ